ncbi:ParB/RepB/Spo0J family partition protein [Amycolatopsis sp. NPDC004079]|uniref:ParB/RepB/Spo0J family partition protein n=1 Tax=Amycolatopsis sp. NPDC004079 TaxID=3154549 RepID=UPI0033B439A5
MGSRWQPVETIQMSDDPFEELFSPAEEPRPISGPVRKISLDSLLPGDSPRIGGEDSEHVRALAQVNGALPPIIVHRPSMRVIDGMHRLRAAALCGERDIAVQFFEGPAEEAFVLAVRYNAHHGLPLSPVDRAAAAARILHFFPRFSDARIASLAGVSDKTVAAIRACSTSETPKSNTRIGKDGRSRPLNAAEGRLRASALFAEKPDATLREIASQAGIALATTRDVRERLRRGEHPVPSPRRRGGASREPVAVAPDSADETSQGDGATGPAAPATPDLRTIGRDPAMRLSEGGREVLRLIGAHSLKQQDWVRLIESVPPHCVPGVADAARSCAETWQHFAWQLEKRRRL